jgi:hypothetical protein
MVGAKIRTRDPTVTLTGAAACADAEADHSEGPITTIATPKRFTDAPW